MISKNKTFNENDPFNEEIWDDQSSTISKEEKIWMDSNAPYSQLLGNSIIPMRPDIGFFIKVEKLDIPEKFFKDEFQNICRSYFSVIEKLDKYYKNSKC